MRPAESEPSWLPADLSKLVALRTKYYFFDPSAGWPVTTDAGMRPAVTTPVSMPA